MTGYLHIPTKGLVEKLTEWFENELTYEQFTKWADEDFAANLSALLRDLSVEPTDESQHGSEDPFVYARTAAKAAGVHDNTIRNWAKAEYIRTYRLHPEGKIKRYSLRDAETCAMAQSAYRRAKR